MKMFFLNVVLSVCLFSCTNAPGDLPEYKNSNNWIKASSSIFGGRYNAFAADPCIFYEEGIYKMYYTDYLASETGPPTTDIAYALSEDGLSWEVFNIGEGTLYGSVLQPREDNWDQHIETVFVIPGNNGNYFMYYGGYLNTGAIIYPGSDFIETMGSSLGRANSSDGIHFTRALAEKTLESTIGFYDEDSIFSPFILKEENSYNMIYTGHWYDTDLNGNMSDTSGIYILGATSEDGKSWQKNDFPVLIAALQYPENDVTHSYDWMSWGVAEPGWLKGPDGIYYLFFQGMNDDKPPVIGMARSENLFGPYEVFPEPIIVPTRGSFDSDGTIAPHPIFIDGKVRIYYNALKISWLSKKESWGIGYAEKEWPIW